MRGHAARGPGAASIVGHVAHGTTADGLPYLAMEWLYSLDDGLVAMREAVRLADELGEPIVRDHMRQYLATCLAEHGGDADLEEARELARSVVERTSTRNVYRGLGLISMALVRLREGDLAGAEADAREARATMREITLRSYYPYAEAALLQVLVRRGDPEAGALADEALATVDAIGPLGLIEPALRLAAARAHLAVGRHDDAARGIARALACVDRRAARILDASLRARFLTEVPENAALRELGRAL
jgi:hypothetical protein